MPFIQKFLEHTKIYESPTSFWKWAAYSAIASVLRDNCYLKQGDDLLFANIYVLLLADSAVQRKGRPVRLCEKFVKKINNTKVISGKASVQGIFDEMASTETDSKTGKITKGGSATFFAEELSASLVGDPQAVSTLTNMYDYKEEYKELLRVRGKMKIDRMVFTLFAASNEDLLKDVYNKSAIQGGLLGRTFLVIPNEFRTSNSLLDSIDTSQSFGETLLDLKVISELRGEFTFDMAAKKEYDDWYSPFRDSYKAKPDRSGIVGRLHTGVIKLAFILAANEGSLLLCKCHIEEAIAECIALIPNYNTFIFASGKSTIAEAGGIVIQDLLGAVEYKLTRKKILQIHWKDFDNETLDKVIITLELGGHIRTITAGNEVLFQLTEHCISFMRGGK